MATIPWGGGGRGWPTAVLGMVAAAGLISACSGGTPSAAGGTVSATSLARRTTTSTAVATTTTVVGTTLPTPTQAISDGDSGDQVMALQRRLAELRYDPGKIDGKYGEATWSAVMAFQKVNGMKRTGEATADVLQKMATATTPPALVPGGGALRVEVDLTRQVLFLYEDDRLYLISPISSGSGQWFCTPDRCSVATTPTGDYKVTWRANGWWTSDLGQLYNPLFFNDGIAIHGALSVPEYPASHGCVRIPMHIAEWLPSHITAGTPVYVRGDPGTPAPGPRPVTTTSAPPPPPPPPSTSTTTAPKSTSTTAPPRSTTSTTAP